MYAQGRIKANVAKYSQVGTRGGITGAQVARERCKSVPSIIKDLQVFSVI
jgi:Zn-dependent membrane protease YugP